MIGSERNEERCGNALLQHDAPNLNTACDVSSKAVLPLFCEIIWINSRNNAGTAAPTGSYTHKKLNHARAHQVRSIDDHYE